jgi:hypothetical protein
MRGLISRRLPVPSLTKVKERRPRLRPVAMLKVTGVATSGEVKCREADIRLFDYLGARVRAATIALPTRAASV